MSNKFNMGGNVRYEGFMDPDCRSVITFWDDFLQSSHGATDACRWLATETTGACATVAATDGEQEMAGGLVSLITQATTDDLCTLCANGEHFQLDQGYSLYYESRWSMLDTGNALMVIGLGKAAGTTIASTPSSPEIAFVCPGDDSLSIITVNAGGTNTDNDVAVIADGIWYRTAFYYDGANTVNFWVATAAGNFEHVKTLKLDTVADYVPQDLMLTPVIELEADTAVAQTMYVDYVLVQQARCLAPE